MYYLHGFMDHGMQRNVRLFWNVSEGCTETLPEHAVFVYLSGGNRSSRPRDRVSVYLACFLSWRFSWSDLWWLSFPSEAWVPHPHHIPQMRFYMFRSYPPSVFWILGWVVQVGAVFPRILGVCTLGFAWSLSFVLTQLVRCPVFCMESMQNLIGAHGLTSRGHTWVAWPIKCK